VRNADFQTSVTRLSDFICPAILLLIAIAIAYPRWRAGIDWRDEGLLAYGAERVLHGEVPHRDFVSLQPPLSFYAAAAAFELGGTSLATLRVFGLTIFLLLPVLIYAVGRNFLGPILSFAAAVPACILGLPYVYFVPLAVWQGITISFAAVLLFIVAIRLQRPSLAMPAGALTSLALLLRHDQAVYTMVALLVLLVALQFAPDASLSKTDLRGFFYFWSGGIAIILIPAMLVWWKIGALPEMFRQLVVFPFATYRKTSALPFPRFTAGKTISERAIVLLYYLPPFIQVLAALYLGQSISRRRFREREAILSFLFVWSTLFYLQVMVRSDQTHLLMTLPPFFLLCAFCWSILQRTLNKYRGLGMLLSAVASIGVVSFLWILRLMVLPDVTHGTDRLSLSRGGIFIAQPNVVTQFVRQIQDLVPLSKSILALPYQPMLYFLCERHNPTRWNYLWPGDQTANDHERFIEEAERDPPAIVLLSDQSQFADSAPMIMEYLRTHYLLTDQVGDIAIYERLETR
jgi:hypothetical protein